MNDSRLIPLLHPKRQEGSDVIWVGEVPTGKTLLMLVDGATESTIDHFMDEVVDALDDENGASHLSIHALKSEATSVYPAWDHSDANNLVAISGDWALLSGIHSYVHIDKN